MEGVGQEGLTLWEYGRRVGEEGRGRSGLDHGPGEAPTAEQNDHQQISMLTAYAGRCAWVSGVGGARGAARRGPGPGALAGTGALCAFTLAAGATVPTNELSGPRAGLLSGLLREAGQDSAQTPTRESGGHPRPGHVRAWLIRSSAAATCYAPR